MELAHLMELWWVLPCTTVFCATAIGTGVSGALFYSPFFMFVVGLPPVESIGAGLSTQLFGMGNGLRSYVQQSVVDYETAKWILVASVPSVVIGGGFSSVVPTGWLKSGLAAMLLILGAVMLFGSGSSEEDERASSDVVVEETGEVSSSETRIEARGGEVFRYPEPPLVPNIGFGALGGLSTGMISAGLPEMTTTYLVSRCRVPPRVAIATSIFVMGVTTAVGSFTYAFAAELPWAVLVWSVPGVLAGSTIGSQFGKHIPGETLEIVVGTIFSAMGIAVLGLTLGW